MRRFALTIAMLLAVGVGTAAAAAPLNSSPPTISGIAQQGETLTASPGTWTGTEPIGYTYRWLRCDDTGGSCSAIIGADTRTRVVTSADVGDTLRVQVRASNADGSGTATSVPTAVVRPKPQPPVRVTLDASRSSVVYGSRLFLSGVISSAQAGEAVTIMENRFPFGRTSQARALTTVTTTAGGEFSLSVRPRIQTLYTATAGTARSEPVAVSVQPRLRLSRLVAPHRFLFRASAVRSLVGKYGVLQRWNGRAGVWVSMRRVYLTSAATISPSTIVSRGTFRLLDRGMRVRVFMPRSQTAPGYVSGSTNRLFV